MKPLVYSDPSFSGLYYIGSSPHLGWLHRAMVISLVMSMFYLISQSVSSYRIHMCCILSGLTVFRACVTMTKSLGLGQLLWLPKLWGLLLTQQHLRYMTLFRFLSPLDLSCLSCRVKSLAGKQAPSSYWLNDGYCIIVLVISFAFHSFFSPLFFGENSGCLCENNAEILIWRWCAVCIGRHVAVATDHTPCNSITFENETRSHHGCALGI